LLNPKEVKFSFVDVGRVFMLEVLLNTIFFLNSVGRPYWPKTAYIFVKDFGQPALFQHCGITVICVFITHTTG